MLKFEPNFKTFAHLEHGSVYCASATSVCHFSLKLSAQLDCIEGNATTTIIFPNLWCRPTTMNATRFGPFKAFLSQELILPPRVFFLPFSTKSVLPCPPGVKSNLHG